MTFNPSKRDAELQLALTSWDSILEENENVVRILREGMIVTESEYQEYMDNRN